VELDKLFMDVCAYNERSATHVQNVVDLAWRIALAYRQVAHVTFPVDIQDHTVREEKRSKRNLPHHTSEAWAQSGRLPREQDLRQAADILNSGKKVAILCGRGAIHATDELEQTAELLAAPIAGDPAGCG
jgi:pyruvate dehydrogenase (quinone)/pyruvate oxidase